MHVLGLSNISVVAIAFKAYLNVRQHLGEPAGAHRQVYYLSMPCIGQVRENNFFVFTDFVLSLPGSPCRYSACTSSTCASHDNAVLPLLCIRHRSALPNLIPCAGMGTKG